MLSALQRGQERPRHEKLDNVFDVAYMRTYLDLEFSYFSGRRSNVGRNRIALCGTWGSNGMPYAPRRALRARR
jgi:hypothetical protein